MDKSKANNDSKEPSSKSKAKANSADAGDGKNAKPLKENKESKNAKKPVPLEFEDSIDIQKISADILIEKFDTRKKEIEDDIKMPNEKELFGEEDLDLEDMSLETNLIPTDTSDRTILVVDEECPRRKETVTIIRQILPNAEIEEADDPEEAHEMMEEVDFDTYVVNFLMPGFSSSPFVKAVINHPEHPLLIGFAADKMSDAVDPKKGLKIIPLKRLFDLEATTAPEGGEDTEEEGVEDTDAEDIE